MRYKLQLRMQLYHSIPRIGDISYFPPILYLIRENGVFICDRGYFLAEIVIRTGDPSSVYLPAGPGHLLQQQRRLQIG